jgi:hypothetical protein
MTMNAPSLINEPPTGSARRNTLLLGTSPGIWGTHNPEAVPFDTVTFLLRAEQARAASNAHGVFFAVDSRMNGARIDQDAIARRTDRLRALVERVTPAFEMHTQSDLDRRGFSATLDGISHPDIAEERLRHYTRVQTAQVAHLFSESRQHGRDGVFEKFGWMVSRDNGKPFGGEATFDASLPETLLIQRTYTAPGFDLLEAKAKAPYLAGFKPSERVLIPSRTDRIARELGKLHRGVRRIGLETIRTTALVLLGEMPPSAVNAEELAILPLAAEMRLVIQNKSTIRDVRNLLEAALSTLVP